MMLKTRRSDFSGVPIFFHSPPCDIQHDAAYAHALAMAMESIDESNGPIARATVVVIAQNAAELMKEWRIGE